jgi:hypothetical protein
MLFTLLGLNGPRLAPRDAGSTLDMKSEPSRDHTQEPLPALGSAGEDFYSMLSHAIDAARSDDVQLRRFIYEVARAKLQRQGWTRQPPVGILEMRQYLHALEVAIKRIESDASERTERRTIQAIEGSEAKTENDPIVIQHNNPIEGLGPLQRVPPTIEGAEAKTKVVPFAIHQVSIEGRNPRPPTSLSSASRSLVRESTRQWSAVRIALRLTAAAIMVGLLFSILTGRADLSNLRSELQSRLSIDEPTSNGRVTSIKGKMPSSDSDQGIDPAPPAPPLPTVYGVYALSNGQLTELNTLPVIVPDQRIFMSAPITSPSRTILPDGRVVFIAFRRDFVTSAPEKIAIRIVARVMQSLTFDPARKAKFTKVDGQWALRGNAYDFRVAPLKNNPEMIAIQPEKEEFAFPAGRYALVLKGQAYDFSIDGPITEPAQCIERTEALNGPVYSECPNPQ